MKYGQIFHKCHLFFSFSLILQNQILTALFLAVTVDECRLHFRNNDPSHTAQNKDICFSRCRITFIMRQIAEVKRAYHVRFPYIKWYKCKFLCCHNQNGISTGLLLASDGALAGVSFSFFPEKMNSTFSTITLMRDIDLPSSLFHLSCLRRPSMIIC